MGRFVCTTSTPKETEALGASLVQLLPAGTLLALIGDLGAGKTALARGMVRGFLGAEGTEEFSSPTFTLCHSYGPDVQGCRLHHFDAYRLETAEAFVAAGLDEYWMTPDTICIIEWANLIESILPEGRTCVLEIQRSWPDASNSLDAQHAGEEVLWDLSNCGLEAQTRTWNLEIPPVLDGTLGVGLRETGEWEEIL